LGYISSVLVALQVFQPEISAYLHDSPPSTRGLVSELHALNYLRAHNSLVDAIFWVVSILVVLIEFLPFLMQVLIYLAPPSTYESILQEEYRFALRMAEDERANRRRAAFLAVQAEAERAQQFRAARNSMAAGIVRETIEAERRVEMARLEIWESRQLATIRRPGEVSSSDRQGTLPLSEVGPPADDSAPDIHNHPRGGRDEDEENSQGQLADKGFSTRPRTPHRDRWNVHEPSIPSSIMLPQKDSVFEKPDSRPIWQAFTDGLGKTFDIFNTVHPIVAPKEASTSLAEDAHALCVVLGLIGTEEGANSEGRQ
jgi:hypothetical protein